MKVKNLTSPRTGSEVANQFVISDGNTEVFQSYRSVIGRKTFGADYRIELDAVYYNYSRTTAKYRNQWLGMDTKEIERKIKDGNIVLTDLNKDN